MDNLSQDPGLSYNPEVTSESAYYFLGPDWCEQTRDGKPEVYAKRKDAPHPRAAGHCWPHLPSYSARDPHFAFPGIDLDTVYRFYTLRYRSEYGAGKPRAEAKRELREATEFCRREDAKPLTPLERDERARGLSVAQEDLEAQQRGFRFLEGYLAFSRVMNDYVREPYSASRR
jgi:hypothetical protein